MPENASMPARQEFRCLSQSGTAVDQAAVPAHVAADAQAEPRPAARRRHRAILTGRNPRWHTFFLDDGEEAGGSPTPPRLWTTRPATAVIRRRFRTCARQFPCSCRSSSRSLRRHSLSRNSPPTSRTLPTPWSTSWWARPPAGRSWTICSGPSSSPNSSTRRPPTAMDPKGDAAVRR